MQRSEGKLDGGGDVKLSQQLIEALLAASRDDVVADSLTHPFHTYPARMHPATARALVEIAADLRQPASLPILDPFCGSGTTLVEARAAGIPSMGIDLNPLAVLLARVKTWTVPRPRRESVRLTGGRFAGEVMAVGRQARRAGFEGSAWRGPEGFDPNARNRRLSKWYAPHTRRELEELAARIDGERSEDAEIADALTAALSSILYKVSSRTSDTDPTWIDRKIARGAPTRLFAERVELLCAGLADLAKVPGSVPKVIEADSRTLVSHVGEGGARAIITSPPYAGTYDYAEHQRLRFDFLGLRHREMDDREIGSRRSFVKSAVAAGERWQSDLRSLFDSFARALAPGALALIVIGDSLAGGKARFALDDVRSAVPGSLNLVAWASQTRPLLGVESAAFGDRYKCEHAIALHRPRT